MERKLFGTDGIRGVANSHPVTAELAMKVGMAAGSYFANKNSSHRPSVVIAKDTRLSGYMIEPALTSGFISVGMDVFLVGPMPTPAVSMLVRSLRADLGVMISASHNPFHDNGIKLFGPDGCKLSDEVELEIEKIISKGGSAVKLAAPDMLGRAKRLDDAPGRYIEYVKNTFPKDVRLNGLRIVVDCANGAAYHIAPKVFWELGAEVIDVAVEPNGFNINLECGSTHPDRMIAEVRKSKAHLGIALDGDADRVVMCDEEGNLIDGDQLIGLIAGYWHKTGIVKGGGVVTTVMSNLGLEKYLKGIGLEMIRAKVGDRYVLEEMMNHGMNIGGEQSGHIILGDYGSTGDGIVTALQVLAVLKEKQRPFSEIAKVFDPFPQVLKSIRYGKGMPLEQKSVVEAIKQAERRLNGKGRLVVRKSGTEPLIRVMGEGENQKDVETAVDHILDTIKEVI